MNYCRAIRSPPFERAIAPISISRRPAGGRYSSVSEYIRDLIRGDEKLRAQERLEAMLLEGLAGESTEMSRQDWDDVRREAMAILKSRNTTGR